jgi:hypothetical protein
MSDNCFRGIAAGILCGMDAQPHPTLPPEAGKPQSWGGAINRIGRKEVLNSAPTVEIIATGSELLSGKGLNTNAAWLSREFTGEAIR